MLYHTLPYLQVLMYTCISGYCCTIHYHFSRYCCTVHCHISRYCWSTEGGTLFIGDLPPSTTEDWVKFLVGDLGAFSYLKVPSCPTP